MSNSIYAKLYVVTSTTNLASLVKSIGGSEVDAFSFCKGTQDPHYLTARPSYMLKAAKADLLVSVGLELEIGWLPLIVRGSRNPKLLIGAPGRLVAGDYITPLEIPHGKISRAEGDVHPEGNPHFMLSPENALKVAVAIKDRLSLLAPESKSLFTHNYNQWKKKVLQKLVSWKQQIPAELKVITYHKTLTYFFHQFGIKNIAFLEPKPGVPPTAGHILEVIKLAKQQGVKLVLVENYFDPAVAEKVVRSMKGIEIKSIPVAVHGNQKVDDLISLYQFLVDSMSR